MSYTTDWFPVPVDPSGLCGHCAFCRAITTDRSTFYLCERSLTDPRYRKYPVLPVIACPGYAPRDASPKRRDDKLDA